MQLIYGSKAGQKKPHTPQIADDTVASITKVTALYLLGEGEIKGLVNGAKSIFFEDTPLEDEDGNRNFENVTWEIRHGTVDQTHIPGVPSASTEQLINTELRSGTPWTRLITDTQLSSININVSWPRLSKMEDNGDVNGTTVDYAIDVRTDGGAWITMVSKSLTAKTSGRYQRTHNIPLPDADNNWQVRVRKITEDGDNERLFNQMQIDSIAEIIDAKLCYPHSAVIKLTWDSRTFGSNPKVSFETYGLYVKVPTNYDADTRKSTGLWNGTFKEAYTTNPAWIYYDLITNDRYGLGNKIKPYMINKWAVERIARLCDVMVDDGKGGLEPRYTCNLYLQTAETAFDVLQHIAGIFRGMVFWDGSQIVLDADTYKDCDYVITRANVINGEFVKSGTAKNERHTVAKVGYSNPDNNYEVDYVYVRNERAIAELGINELDLSAIACTSEGEAYRFGLSALLTEQNRTQTISFAMGLDGALPMVGDRVDIADPMFTGHNTGGRISGVNDDRTVITVDRDNVPVDAGDKLVVNLESGKAQTREIVAINGREITVSVPFDPVSAQNVWAVNTDEMPTMPFIVLSIKANEDGTQYNYSALQYDATLQQQIDNGTIIENKPPLPPLMQMIIDAPESVSITSRHRIEQAQTITTLVITWDQVKDAVAYDVEWRKDDGDWVKVPRTGNISVEIDGVYSGNYLARVRAVSAFDAVSKPTTSTLTAIKGKAGKPPSLLSLKATGILFGMELSWSFESGSDDTAYTEIQVASAPDTNVALLGQYAYNTDNAKVTGLQANLTQYYRGRIVDKLGNMSDWTDWVSGTTDASADKVLGILSGQITKSQLHQSLSTPIGKIGGIDTAVNNINSQLPSLNAQLSQAKIDITNAQSQLATAVSNIDTERNRITGAIKNIGKLQQQTDEQKQQVNSLTTKQNQLSSSIEQINTTIVKNNESLSQQINSINAKADKASSDIRDVNQALANERESRTTAVNEISAKFDSLEIGGRNLLVGMSDTWSSKTFSGWQLYFSGIHEIAIGENTLLQSGDIITVSGILNPAEQETALMFHFWLDSGYRQMISDTVRGGKTGKIVHTVTIPKNAERLWIALRHTSGSTPRDTVRYKGLKLEKGNKATDWTPAPEDVEADIAQVATQANANIESLRQVVTNADSALSTRIDTLDASFNSNKASVSQQIKTLTDKDSATSQKISSLDSSVKGAQSKITDLEKATSDNTKAISTTHSQLSAKFDGLEIGGRNLVQKRDIDNFVAYNGANNSIKELDVYRHEVTSTGGSGNSLSLLRTYTPQVLGYGFKTGDAFSISFDLENIGNNALECRFNRFGDGNRTDTIKKGFKGRVGFSGYVDNSTHFQIQILNPDTTKPIKFIISKIKVEKGNKATDWTPAPEDVQADINATQASLDEFKQSQATKDGATSQKLTQLEANLGTKANSTTVNQLSNRVERADGKINAEAKKVSTLQTTVNNNTASIRTQQQSVDGLSAMSTVTLDVNGYVTGVGSYNDGKTGTFAVRADEFWVGAPDGSKKQGFVYYATPQTINGVTVPRGLYLDSARIADASIDSAKIASAAIDTAKLKDAAITSAKIDDLAVTSGKIANLAVDTLQIAGNAVSLPLSSSVKSKVSIPNSLNHSNSVEVASIDIPIASGLCTVSFSSAYTVSFESDFEGRADVRAELLIDGVVVDDIGQLLSVRGKGREHTVPVIASRHVSITKPCRVSIRISNSFYFRKYTPESSVFNRYLQILVMRR